MKISERFRKLLRERCERLIESGINCFPKWVDSQAPAFKKGEQYQKFLTTPIGEDENFKKLILERFSNPRVGGIVVVGRVQGLVAIDNDAVKVVNLEKEFAKLVIEYGHIIYIDRRIVVHPKIKLKGLHAILFIDKQLFNKYIIKIKHSYNAEFSIKSRGLITVYPSLRIEKQNAGYELSVYVKASTSDIFDAIFDERLEVLQKIAEIFNAKVEMIPIDYSVAETGEYEGTPGQPWHGLQYKEINQDNVFLFLKNYARLIRCEGLERLAASLEKEEPIPIPYEIYNSMVQDANHPRSTWTLAENIVGRVLGEVGADESALLKVREAFEKSEKLYMKSNGNVDHKTTRANLTRAYRFKEFGHDKPGACIFYLLGLCRENCGLTCWLRLKSAANREALEKAVALTLSGKEVEVDENA